MEMSTNTSILSSVLCRAFTLLLLVLGLRSGVYFCPLDLCFHLCDGDDSGVEGRAGEAGLRERPGTANWWVATWQEEPPEVVEVEPVVVEVILELG